jgi:hypothetical protein
MGCQKIKNGCPCAENRKNGLCVFMTLNSLTAVSVWAFGKNRAGKQAQIERMKEMSELFMFPATFLMGAGIFIGAIWANMS